MLYTTHYLNVNMDEQNLNCWIFLMKKQNRRNYIFLFFRTPFCSSNGKRMNIHISK